MNFFLFQHAAGGILRVGGGTQQQRRFIGLFRVFEKFHTAGGTTHKNRQNTGGHGVQRAAVTDAAGIEHAAQSGRHVLTGPFLRFIYNYDSVH